MVPPGPSFLRFWRMMPWAQSTFLVLSQTHTGGPDPLCSLTFPGQPIQFMEISPARHVSKIE